jgi:transcriptional regulator with XRE-family HTH domain
MKTVSWMTKARKDKKLTQQQISDIVGLSRAYVAQIELGLRLPHPSKAMKLGQILDISWTRWFEDPINPSLMEINL